VVRPLDEGGTGDGGAVMAWGSDARRSEASMFVWAPRWSDDCRGTGLAARMRRRPRHIR